MGCQASRPTSDQPLPFPATTSTSTLRKAEDADPDIPMNSSNTAHTIVTINTNNTTNTNTTASSSAVQPSASATLLGRERDGRGGVGGGGEARCCQDLDIVKGAKGGAKEVLERKAKQRNVVLISTVIPTNFSDGTDLPEESSTHPSAVACRCRARKPTPFRWADPKDTEELELELEENREEGEEKEDAVAEKGRSGGRTNLEAEEGSCCGSDQEIQHGLLLQTPVPTSDAYALLKGNGCDALRGYTLQRVKSKDFDASGGECDIHEFFRPLDTLETDCSKVPVLDAMEHSLTLERCCV